MITISIVTYNTTIEELKKCLSSLTSSSIAKIYIVDNSSQKYIENFCNDYNNVEYSACLNIGYGAAHNVAIRKAIGIGSKYHLVLNSDVYFDSEVLDTLEKYMDENLDIAQIQPNIVYPDGRQQYTCRMLPTPANLIFRRFLPKKMIENMNYRYQLKFADRTKEMDIPYHQGSFMFFRTECFNKVGLFDERFFMYPEDIDITRRMHKFYKTMYWPYVTIVHAHKAASYKSKKMLRIHMMNMIKYFNKWGWFIDKERKDWNKKLLKDLGYNNK